MNTSLMNLSNSLSNRLGMGDTGSEVVEILKATAFKGGAQQVTDAQMTSLMIVAEQYGLNPFTREIYAFPDKGGIIPVVGVDGWARIINEHPQFDGLEFLQDDESCTCIMHRKDRNYPTRVTEWLSECKRNTQPWQTHPKRLLRHKSLIQCARLAFGFVGIFDQDEAERIMEVDGSTGEIIKKPDFQKPPLEYCTDEAFESKSDAWFELIASGKKTAEEVISTVQTRYLFTDQQKEIIISWGQYEIN